MKVIKYIQSDLYRYSGKISVINFLRYYFFNQAFHVQVWFRLSVLGGPVGLIATVISEMLQRKTGIILGVGTKIGYGLYIGHSGPVVINQGTKIGDNVNLSQFTSIGSNSSNFAIIGNNVYIGPNVSIVEGVSIGNNVTIGAGSVVVKDIDDNATAAGNYAKVLNYNNPGRFINKIWRKECE